MLKQHHRLLETVLAVGDVSITAVALLGAYWVRFRLPFVVAAFPIRHGRPPLELFINPIVIGIVTVLWVTVFYFNGLYRTRRGKPVIEEVFAVFNSVLICVLVLLGLTFFDRYHSYSRGVVLAFFAIDFVMIAAFRITLRQFLKAIRRKGMNLRHVLIIGAGRLGQEFAEKILDYAEAGLELVGFVDDDPEKAGVVFCGRKVLGTLEDTPRIVREHGIDQMYVALPLSAHRRMMEIFSTFQHELVDIKLIPDILQYITLRAQLEDFDGIPVINLSATPITGWKSLIKRLMDLTISVGALVVLLPPMLVVALLIKLTSSGPVFYRQERMGLDGRSFSILKFRSMYVDAERETGPVWAKEGDPRCTPVGRVLRHFSIDELPQLINVLWGEMSLVGPRPERPSFVEEFRRRLPRYMLRHKVKSGITGWAQVNGLRGNTSIERRLIYDLYYIQNWSLSFDLRIILMTLLRLSRNAV